MNWLKNLKEVKEKHEKLVDDERSKQEFKSLHQKLHKKFLKNQDPSSSDEDEKTDLQKAEETLAGIIQDAVQAAKRNEGVRKVVAEINRKAEELERAEDSQEEDQGPIQYFVGSIVATEAPVQSIYSELTTQFDEPRLNQIDEKAGCSAQTVDGRKWILVSVQDRQSKQQQHRLYFIQYGGQSELIQVADYFEDREPVQIITFEDESSYILTKQKVESGSFISSESWALQLTNKQFEFDSEKYTLSFEPHLYTVLKADEHSFTILVTGRSSLKEAELITIESQEEGPTITNASDAHSEVLKSSSSFISLLQQQAFMKKPTCPSLSDLRITSAVPVVWETRRHFVICTENKLSKASSLTVITTNQSQYVVTDFLRFDCRISEINLSAVTKNYAKLLITYKSNKLMEVSMRLFEAPTQFQNRV